MAYSCAVCGEPLTPESVADHLLTHEPDLVGVEVEQASEADARYWPSPPGVPTADAE